MRLISERQYIYIYIWRDISERQDFLARTVYIYITYISSFMHIMQIYSITCSLFNPHDLCLFACLSHSVIPCLLYVNNLCMFFNKILEIRRCTLKYLTVVFTAFLRQKNLKSGDVFPAWFRFVCGQSSQSTRSPSCFPTPSIFKAL